MKKHVIFFGAAFFLAGCATSNKSEITWYKPNASSEDMYRVRAQCMSMAGPGGQQIIPVYGSSVSAGFLRGYNQASAINAQSERQQVFHECMMGNGFALMTKQQAQGMRAASSRNTVDMYWRRVEESVPDFREINDDPRFQDWLNEIDNETGLRRKELLKEAQHDFDVERVTSIYRQFLNSG